LNGSESLGEGVAVGVGDCCAFEEIDIEKEQSNKQMNKQFKRRPVPGKVCDIP
jgi:hypothetical protein